MSVVVVLHNSADGLAACLESLPPEVELVVVDNASADAGPDMARRIRPDAKVLELGENVGFGRGCNAGARAASRDVVVFLNPDTVVLEGALDVLGSAVLDAPSSVVGPRLIDETGETVFTVRRRSRPIHEVVELLPVVGPRAPAWLRRDRPPTDPVYSGGGEADHFQGACLAVGRDCFLRLGGFDEDLFLYSEEELLAATVRAAGGRVVYEPRAAVRHIGGTSTAHVPAFSTYHMFRSRAILYRKRHGDLAGRLRLLPIAFALALAAAYWPLARLRRVGRPGSYYPAALRGLWRGSRARLR